MSQTEKNSGILLNITSLPNRGFIGTLGQQAYEFIDFLYTTKQTYWQILPIHPPNSHSPYDSLSAFAGSPLLIDLLNLKKRGLLSSLPPSIKTKCVDYSLAKKIKTPYLFKAYKKFCSKSNNIEKLKIFIDKNRYWLLDYAVFMILLNKYNCSWDTWHHTYEDKNLLHDIQKNYKEEYLFHVFNQYIFAEQWLSVKQYANKKGIKIIGDLPIYVSFQSADIFAHKELFQLDKCSKPKYIAGVPPDYFNKEGQVWGNPLYNWKKHQLTNYDWWHKRISYTLRIFDLLRIDHFRGFSNYWSIPYNKKAFHGKWKKGPGYDFFKNLDFKRNKSPFIAENLGEIDDKVIKLKNKLDFSGMQVLQFGLESCNLKNPHLLPSHNDFYYTGTHDNDTILGWYQNCSSDVKNFTKNILQKSQPNNWDFIQYCFNKDSQTVIIPMQDILGLGSESRMNTPGTSDKNNWQWKLDSWDNTLIYQDQLLKLVEKTERSNTYQ